MEIQAFNIPRPEGFIECRTVLDIGAGLRPAAWHKPTVHMCIEPHRPYAEKLWAAGYQAICDHALHALRFLTPGDYEAVYMLDVIEHLERPAGEELLEAVQALKPKQIIVFTPNGFMPQSHDAWGMGGEHWQTHRSGWVPEDFPGWQITPYHPNFFAVSP